MGIVITDHIYTATGSRGCVQCVDKPLPGPSLGAKMCGFSIIIIALLIVVKCYVS